MMQVVFDTNIVISGMFWAGAPYEAYQLVRASKVKLLTSQALIDELYSVLVRPKLASRIARLHTTPAALLEVYRLMAYSVIAANLPPVVIADPKDDRILACAVGGEADLIVSGDHHLLDLGNYQNIPIIDIHEFLGRFAAE